MAALPETLFCPVCRQPMKQTGTTTYWCAHHAVVLTARSSPGSETRMSVRSEPAPHPAPSGRTAPPAASGNTRRRARLEAVEAEPKDVKIGDYLALDDGLCLITDMRKAGRSGTARLLHLWDGSTYVAQGSHRVYRDTAAPPPTTAQRAAAHRR